MYYYFPYFQNECNSLKNAGKIGKHTVRKIGVVPCNEPVPIPHFRRRYIRFGMHETEEIIENILQNAFPQIVIFLHISSF